MACMIFYIFSALISLRALRPELRDLSKENKEENMVDNQSTALYSPLSAVDIELHPVYPNKSN